MGMPRYAAALAVALLAVSSCGREERPRTARKTSPASPAPGHYLAERLAAEAAARPSGTVTVEDVVAALGAAGDPAIAERQVVASIVGARYCAILETRSGLLLSVCEFESRQAAETGVQVSRARFDRLVPGRRFELNGSTLLTITPRQGGETDDPSGSVRELFAALSPHRQERKQQ
jgi:hypothetical protein